MSPCVASPSLKKTSRENAPSPASRVHNASSLRGRINIMAKTHLFKLRIKDKRTLLAWCKELNRRKDEVLETMEPEGISMEACFLSDDEKYLYYFVESEDIEKSNQILQKSTFKLDIEHKEV